MRPLRPRDADGLPGPLRLAQPAQAGRPDRRRAAAPAGDRLRGRAARAGSRSCSSGSASPPSTTTATRTSSPAASGSGSASPGRSRCEPKLIVADEPVSALDVSIQAQIVNLLEDLQEELGLTYVFVAHDIGVVRHVSDRIAVMHRGQDRRGGPGRPGLRAARRPLHPQTLLAAVPIPDPRESRARRASVAGRVNLPLEPPIKPQLALTRKALPTGRGVGLRAEARRLPRDRLRRRRRVLHPVARGQSALPLLPRAQLRARALRARRRAGDPRRRRQRSNSTPCRAASTPPSRGSTCSRRRSRPSTSPSTCSPRATSRCSRRRWASAASGSRRSASDLDLSARRR